MLDTEPACQLFSNASPKSNPFFSLYNKDFLHFLKILLTNQIPRQWQYFCPRVDVAFGPHQDINTCPHIHTEMQNNLFAYNSIKISWFTGNPDFPTLSHPPSPPQNLAINWSVESDQFYFFLTGKHNSITQD